MVNEHEAAEALENLLDRGHTLLHGLVDDLFLRADAMLDKVKSNLPQAADAGMGGEAPAPAEDEHKANASDVPSAQAQIEAITAAAEGTYMAGVLTPDFLLKNEPLREQIYVTVIRFPNVWRGK